MAATPKPTVEAFSITHAAILTDGLETLDGDIYGVNQGSVEVDADNYDNTGDDDVLSTWSWLNYASLSIQSGYLPFVTYAKMTDQVLYSTGTGASIRYEAELWTTESMNVPPMPVVLRMLSKDEDGLARYLDLLFYKVQFQPISFDGPNYKDGLKINWAGRALKSSTREDGTPVLNRHGNPTKSVGRAISKAFV